MHSYEIEIKSLLGDKDNADKLIQKLKADPSFGTRGSHKELNHYFIGGKLEDLFKNTERYLTEKDKARFNDIIRNAKTFSVRTRRVDDKVILVIKASVDDTTSANGTARIEFEPEMKDFTLEQLDGLVLKSGFKYQAKWSRERQEFKFRGMNVSVDKNAGYGYLAEFEKITDDVAKIEEIKNEIRNTLKEFEILELPQDRLSRMFDFYNSHWQDYYGTEEVFNIE